MDREDLRKEFKDLLPFWDGYHFEKSKVSEEVYAYILWLESKIIHKQLGTGSVVHKSPAKINIEAHWDDSHLDPDAGEDN